MVKGKEKGGEGTGGGKGGGKAGGDKVAGGGEKKGTPSPKKGEREEDARGKGKGTPRKGTGLAGSDRPQEEGKKGKGFGDEDGGGTLGKGVGEAHQKERAITEKKIELSLEKDQGKLEGDKDLVGGDKMDEDIALIGEKRKREDDAARHEEEILSSSEEPSPNKALVVYKACKVQMVRGKSYSRSSDEGSEDDMDGGLVPLFEDLNGLPSTLVKTYDNEYYDWETPNTALKLAPLEVHSYSSDEFFEVEELNVDESTAPRDKDPLKPQIQSPAPAVDPQEVAGFPTKKSKKLQPKPKVGIPPIGSGPASSQQGALDAVKTGGRRKSTPSLSQAPPMRTLTKAEKKKGVKADLPFP
ncbi:hypothetical protein CBR_g40052 [Chara braunii]|uniref:Uncharacterized protein n=1 Tax=Chara braunii TaxID=69332 RepID=A0A388LSV8_CHABU|nr:hypothetical protein CBR_g40052 [Chara braunii]|eukprot:GBG85410.1 hypothetical protein CBR_g40052 [Chara braunii]